MPRRKPYKVADPSPLRVWLESAPGYRSNAHLSDITAMLGKRIHAETLAAYAAGRRLPTPANAQLIELATMGAVKRDSWYVIPTRIATGREP